MPPRRFDAREKSSVPSEDNMYEANPTYGVQTPSKFPSTDCASPAGVPLVYTSPSQAFWTGDTYAQSPYKDISNAEFLYSINLLTQLVTS